MPGLPMTLSLLKLTIQRQQRRLFPKDPGSRYRDSSTASSTRGARLQTSF
jgi:hypothetical protein